MTDDREPAGTSAEQIDPTALEVEVSEAVERGVDVREEVRALTATALSSGRLDTERARRVVDAVMDGISRGAQAGEARQHAAEAARGVDEALARAAQALQLTTAEARERFDAYGEDDLGKAQEDLRTLEAILKDAVARLARSSDAMLREVWQDLERHWRDTGTEVGRQSAHAFGDAAEHLRRAGEAQVAASVDAAFAAGAQLADVASGVLAGLAEQLGKGRGKPRPEDD